MAYTEKQLKQRISLGQSNNALTMLIIVNLVLFAALILIRTFFFFMYREDGQAETLFAAKALKWFVVPADLGSLAARPWTLFTSLFAHVGIWAILANMLWLWTFGYIMQDLTGNKKIIPVFIYGGLAGTVAFLAAYNLMPSLQAQVPVATYFGANAGIMAIAIATTMVSSGYRIFPMLNGGIPLWILTIIYVAVSVATVPAYSIEFYLPLIAGAAMGWLFMIMVRNGYDWSEWMNNFYDWINNLFNPDKPKKGSNIKEELFYKSSSKPYSKTPNLTQQRIDEILDKISQKGYGYLTEEEKDLLKRASQEDL
jgi:membrane associated rhomboid family serine protease